MQNILPTFSKEPERVGNVCIMPMLQADSHSELQSATLELRALHIPRVRCWVKHCVVLLEAGFNTLSGCASCSPSPLLFSLEMAARSSRCSPTCTVNISQASCYRANVGIHLNTSKRAQLHALRAVQALIKGSPSWAGMQEVFHAPVVRCV